MTTSYPIASRGFIRAYWITFRPYLCFLSGVSGLVGLATHRPVNHVAFLAAAAVFFLSYGLGQALTDVTQIDTDSLSSPYRPLTQGSVTPRAVASVSLLGLLSCSAVLLVINVWTLPLAVVAVSGLATYTPMKRLWWAGPLWNAGVVAILPWMGALCGGGRPFDALGSAALRWLMLSVFASYAVFVLLGYHKDISADRETGYRTLPVVFGWRTSILVSSCFAIVAVTASVLGIRTTALATSGWQLVSLTAYAMGGVGATLLLGAHLVMWRTRTEQHAHVAIGWVVRGYVLGHLGELIAYWPCLAVPGCLFYAAFELVLAFRPERSQI